MVKQTKRDLLKLAYAAFNRRDVDAVLAALHPEVEWANGMEGGTVHGHQAVRAYWTRQWGLIDPQVEPLSFDEEGTGRVLAAGAGGNTRAIGRTAAGSCGSRRIAPCLGSNGTRIAAGERPLRWCSMAACGNRAKQAAHRDRAERRAA